MRHRLILASASPQRMSLLSTLGIDFDVHPSSIEESACDEPDPEVRATVLARMKAQDVARQHPDAWVLGCDTLVVAPDGTLLEKPRDAEDARRMLRQQIGGVSVVHSAICLIGPDGVSRDALSSSRVFFKQLSEAEIEWWIATGQWKDRSGSFQIDGLGQLVIERLEGDYTGVVGLPVFLLGTLLQKAGISDLLMLN